VPIETRGIFIDTKLLKTRNTIAHGNPLYSDGAPLELTLDFINTLKSVVLIILESFQEDLLEYYEKEFYLNDKEEERFNYSLTREVELSNQLKEVEAA
jgi:hypothetical protein